MSSTVTRTDVCEHCHSDIPSSGETFLANGDEIICQKCHGDGPIKKCSICVTNEVNYTIQGCNHQFCRQCITKWFGVNRNCPLCRNSHVLDSIAYFSTDYDSSLVETIDKHRCTMDFLKENKVLMDKRKLLKQHCNCDRDCKRSIYTLCEHGGTDEAHEEVRRVFQWMAGNVDKAPMHPKCYEEVSYLCIGGFCTKKYLLKSDGCKEEMCAYCRFMNNLKERYEKELKAYRLRLKKGKNTTLIFQRCKVNMVQMAVEFISTERKKELNSFSEEALVIQRLFRMFWCRKHKDVLFSLGRYAHCYGGSIDSNMKFVPLEGKFYPSFHIDVFRHLYSKRFSKKDARCLSCRNDGQLFYKRFVRHVHGDPICDNCFAKEKIAVVNFVAKQGGFREAYFDWPSQETFSMHTFRLSERTMCDSLQRHTPIFLLWSWIECDDCYRTQLFLSELGGQQFPLDHDWDSWEGNHYCYDCKMNYYRCETCDQWFLLDDSDYWDEDALQNEVCKQCVKEEEPKAKRQCTRQ